MHENFSFLFQVTAVDILKWSSLFCLFLLVFLLFLFLFLFKILFLQTYICLLELHYVWYLSINLNWLIFDAYGIYHGISPTSLILSL
jgi:hypothetical protein